MFQKAIAGYLEPSSEFLKAQPLSSHASGSGGTCLHLVVLQKKPSDFLQITKRSRKSRSYNDAFIYFAPRPSI
jgi:hypothetical protein